MPNYEKCFIQHMCCSDSLCSDCQEKIEHILVSYKQKEQEVSELKDTIKKLEELLPGFQNKTFVDISEVKKLTSLLSQKDKELEENQQISDRISTLILERDEAKEELSRLKKENEAMKLLLDGKDLSKSIKDKEIERLQEELQRIKDFGIWINPQTDCISLADNIYTESGKNECVLKERMRLNKEWKEKLSQKDQEWRDKIRDASDDYLLCDWDEENDKHAEYCSKCHFLKKLNINED